MIPFAISLALATASLGQIGIQHYTPGKMAIDLNVESVSLQGKELNRTPAEGDALKQLEKQLVEAENHAAAQPDNAALHVALGHSLEALWRFHEAAQVYTQVIKLNHTDPTGYILRGNTFLKLRWFDQAKNDFEHATVLDPQNAAAWRGIGIAQFLLQKFDDASQALENSMRLERDNVEKAMTDRWAEQVERRLGKPQDSDKPRSSAILSHLDENWMAYAKGQRELMSENQEGALKIWRELADKDDWTSLWVIAAESEIAAIEGAKNRRAATQ